MDDYKDAATRHLHDAQLLFAQTPVRLANASHLYGVSAECSLKAIAVQTHPGARFSGKTGHLPDLFTELLNVANTLAGNVELATSITAIRANFDQWALSQRYQNQGLFDATKVTQEKLGAEQAYALMNNHLQGLI